jgi:putative chitinase
VSRSRRATATNTYTIAANRALYVGSIFIDGTAGQASCHVSVGLNRRWAVWNAYNRLPINLRVVNGTASWTYASTARASNGDTTTRARILCGLNEEFVTNHFAQSVSAPAGTSGAIGVGWNSTSSMSGLRGILNPATSDVNNELAAGMSRRRLSASPMRRASNRRPAPCRSPARPARCRWTAPGAAEGSPRDFSQTSRGLPMLTHEILRAMWPRAPQAKIDAIVSVAPQCFATYGISSALRVAHLMAQVSVENNAGTAIRENMNYSADGLLHTFGVGRHSAAVTPAEAAALARKPQQIAERVYGLGNPKKAKDLGNTRPGDGWKFRGGGDLQATGGKAYRHLTEVCGIDLYADPDLIADPAIAFRAACAEFAALGCLPAADADKTTLVTRKVNGGRNGLPEREAWLKKWKIALPQLPDREPEEDEPVTLPRGAETVLPKTMAQSTIGNAQIGKIITTAVVAGGAAADKMSDDAPAVAGHVDQIGSLIDRGGQALDLANRASELAPAAKPLWKVAVGFMASPEVIAIAVGVVVILSVITWFERRRHLHQDGV